MPAGMLFGLSWGSGPCPVQTFRWEALSAYLLGLLHFPLQGRIQQLVRPAPGLG